MTGLTLHTALPPTATRSIRTQPGVDAAAAAALSPAEAAQIAESFPSRPTVAQKLYGPGRQVTQAPQLGTRIDLSA